MAKKVLVVVDMQNDFITGSLGTPEAQAIVPKVVEKIQGFGGTVLYTQEGYDSGTIALLMSYTGFVIFLGKIICGWSTA